MKKKIIISTIVVFGLLAVLLVVSTQQVSACTVGCTPGFWKNHTDTWAYYKPSDTVGSVFPSVPSEFANDTLYKALKYTGGGVKALLRHAVAFLLTTAYDRYENNCEWHSCYWTETTINSEIANALNQGSAAINRLKDNFEALNELGCPL